MFALVLDALDVRPAQEGAPTAGLGGFGDLGLADGAAHVEVEVEAEVKGEVEGGKGGAAGSPRAAAPVTGGDYDKWVGIAMLGPCSWRALWMAMRR